MNLGINEGSRRDMSRALRYVFFLYIFILNYTNECLKDYSYESRRQVWQGREIGLGINGGSRRVVSRAQGVFLIQFFW
jgi:hypothetical protein